MTTIPLEMPRKPDVALPILMASLRHDRFWIVFWALATLLGALALAIVTVPLYRAESTLLVLLGSEYTYRTVAGENMNAAGALNREQILRTEIEILSEDNLHREVIRTIGPGVLYPELLAPPGLLARVKTSVTESIGRLRESAEGGAPAPKRPADLTEMALRVLNAHLDFLAVKDGNAIELTFSHRDPAIAARVLSLLEDEYLRRRRELYLTQEGALVSHEVEQIREKLEAADAKLSQFKREHGINDYLERRGILLQQQGALETDLRLAKSLIDQDVAKITQLDGQVRNFPGVFNTLTNPLMLQVQLERSKTQAELQATRAQANLDVTHLATVGTGLARLNDDEERMNQLTLARDVLVDDYKASSKIRNERAVTENVELNRKDNVRVLQEPIAPLLPQATRTLILMAGFVLALIVAGAVGLLKHYTRRIYLIPEALESDTGLRVLISIPESRYLARSNLLLGAR